MATKKEEVKKAGKSKLQEFLDAHSIAALTGNQQSSLAGGKKPRNSSNKDDV